VGEKKSGVSWVSVKEGNQKQGGKGDRAEKGLRGQVEEAGEKLVRRFCGPKGGTLPLLGGMPVRSGGFE